MYILHRIEKVHSALSASIRNVRRGPGMIFFAHKRVIWDSFPSVSSSFIVPAKAARTPSERIKQSKGRKGTDSFLMLFSPTLPPRFLSFYAFFFSLHAPVDRALFRPTCAKDWNVTRGQTSLRFTHMKTKWNRLQTISSSLFVSMLRFCSPEANFHPLS